MKRFTHKPPKIGEWLLKLLARYDDNISLRGDFDEEFDAISRTKGYRQAWFWYWCHLFASLPAFFKWSTYGSFAMFKNYFKIALRNIRKHKGYSFINILGLAVGMASSMVIILFILDELSYDRFHEKADRIYRIVSRGKLTFSFNDNLKINYVYTPNVLAKTIRNDFPGVVQLTKINTYRYNIISAGNKNYNRERLLLGDENFFDVLLVFFFNF